MGFRLCLRAWTTFAFLVLCVSCAGVDTASGQVRSGHPRLYITPESLPAIQARADTDDGVAMMKDAVQDYIDNLARTNSDLDGAASHFTISITAFTATVTRNSAYEAEALRQLAYLATLEPTSNVLLTRSHVLALAVGYDWLNYLLVDPSRETQRDAVVNQIVAHMEYLGTDPDHYFSSPQFVSGASRWANVTAFAGALALYGEDSRVEATFDLLLNNWVSGYNPALEAIGEGGGHHMGWFYNSGYSGIEAYFMWRTASSSGEQWVADYLRDDAYFYIYAANRDLRMPVMEDSGRDLIQSGSIQQIALSTGLFANGYAETFMQELEASRYVNAYALIPRVITRSTAAAARPLSELPLSRFFPGSGFLISRDSWTRAEATTVVFKASPFYSAGHHQRDEGTFTIDYRGRLLTDGGHYDGGQGTAFDPMRDHYQNFFSRSVAANILLVRSPNEPEFLEPGSVHDGGQEVRQSEARDVDSMRGDFALNGIVAHSEADACVWARADLSDVYYTGKLSAYTRDLLEVRRPGSSTHPAIYVLDRASLPALSDTALLWHFDQPATVNGSQISSSNEGDGHIRLDILRPRAMTTMSYSGDSKWDVNGVSHPPDPASVLWPYWGRVEVIPTELSPTPTWSTLIRVGDADLVANTETPVDLGRDEWIGTRLGQTLFVVATESTSTITLPVGEPIVDGCIAGLRANGIVDVVVGADPPLRVTANADGLAVIGGVENPDTDGGARADGGTGVAPASGSCSGCSVAESQPSSRVVFGLMLLVCLVAGRWTRRALR